MPYIDVNTNLNLSADQKEAIKAELGRLLPILPGKTEGGLMVAINAGRDMWHGGTNDEPCAFVDVRVFHESPMAAKREFIAAVSKYLEDVYGIPSPRCYLNFTEYRNWGFKGEFRE